MVTSAAVTSDASTRQRLLDAAAALFAAKGFDTVSLRDLTQEAGTNLAAVNYHFGSKDGLIEELIGGFLNPLNQERLTRLDTIEATRQPNPPSVRDVLYALLRPTLMQIRHSEMSEKLFFKLMSRCLSDRMTELPAQVEPMFRQVFERFIAAFARVCPQLSPAEIIMRMSFSVGAVIHTAAHAEVISQMSHGVVSVPETDALVDQLLDFAEAGFQASPTMNPSAPS